MPTPATSDVPDPVAGIGAPARRERRRLWGFRVLAASLPLAALLLLEGMFRWAGIGRPSLAPDPFVGFSAIQPLFEVDTERQIYRIVPSRRKFFAYESFPLAKPANSRRVFCLGGSTVKGEPYSIPTSFTTWLELALNGSDVEVKWDIVNCGGISYASYRLIPILEECLRYEPDLFIICTGHNEFLEDRTYGHLKDPQAVAAAAQQMGGRSHLVTLVRQGLAAMTGEPPLPPDAAPPQLGPETDPILDYNDSLKAYRWDDDWRRGVIAHYEFNLRRMADLAKQAGVPVILVQPPSNLAGCPPFKSEHHPPLTPAWQDRWDELMTSARSHYAMDMAQAIEDLQRAAAISPGYAETLYDLGQCCLATGQVEAARRWLNQARDNDVVPLRMISELEAAMQRVAGERRIPLLNAHALLEAQTPDGLLGDSLLVDHIHPGFDGHQSIAAALAQRMGDLGLVDLPADWELHARERWQRHFLSLDYTYFAQGQRFLRSLEGWTHGQGDGPPAAERFPWRVRESDSR